MDRKTHKIKKIHKIKTGNIKVLNCPSCGAILPLSNNKSTTCSYCGVNVLLSNDLLILNDELPPSTEELDGNNRERHTIIKVEKNRETRRFSNKTISNLGSLGVMSISGIVFYIMAKYYPPNQSNNNLSFLVRTVLLLGSALVAGGTFELLFFEDNVEEDNKLDENSKVK